MIIVKQIGQFNSEHNSHAQTYTIYYVDYNSACHFLECVS